MSEVDVGDRIEKGGRGKQKKKLGSSTKGSFHVGFYFRDGRSNGNYSSAEYI